VPAARELVFGASGYVGSHLVPYLVRLGRAVRATSRNPEVLEARRWGDIDIVRADALDPATLDAALDGIDTAYYLVHSMAAGKGFPELDAEAAQNFADAAARNGVRRIVYLGGLLPKDPRSVHLRSRQETGAVLRSGQVDVSEIRAGMIIGPGSAAWEVIRDLVNNLPVMVTPRWVFSRSTPIALNNLLYYLANVATLDEAANEIYDVGGPDVLTYAEIMRRYGRLVGKKPLIVPVPVLTPRLSSYWLRLVTTVPTNVARALIDGLSQDVIADDGRLAQALPQRLLGFDEAARAALDADRQHAVPARWVEGSIACRDFNPNYAYYAKRQGHDRRTSASSEALFREICRFGYRGDFFSGRLLWWIRRAGDWLIGGPSFRRPRRHPDELRVGDVVDSWRVIALEPDVSVTFLMEMRAPGAGVLEYTIQDNGDHRIVSVYAYWHPAGAWGLLYWYALVPFHGYIFRGATRCVVKRASAASAVSS
jgi:uncharacterized protein YbjT (DUF2867 family)